MTIRELLLLSWMAYLDMPPLYMSILKSGGSVPVRALADYTLRMDESGRLNCIKLSEASRSAAREMLKSEYMITGYINNNDADGFAAFAVKTDAGYVIAMRGSETAGECVASNIDWVDNICEPFTGSVQLDAIRGVAARFENDRVIFTGHSKGGHNALLAAAFTQNPQARAVAFNAQGFSRSALEDPEISRLTAKGVNYVVADDIVGALLEHPEKRVFVKQAPGTNAHMPEAFLFDDEGSPIPARRTLRSLSVELATRFADIRIGGRARTGIRGICRSVLGDM